ncbi:hypothetical protein ABB37_07938 [Leptomonas pyrrhocoris]|uniref:Uncharacterized protein n=1 Tax=Leptomonas pyrrhocoris TaxID=157538 RepID=A0A0M9FUF7_LEPPY|nr:hypothetical protein ABB37_07938 [Leptomonas pyrrhocoris]KPA76179.1 hypothetical protein ABB37_07938 [Leptomonas pyrrhocoris]|eukprot:XP_015654618.1 hypothetical protein ABB37_07938 [Leptomonas pyrrhocoris]
MIRSVTSDDLPESQRPAMPSSSSSQTPIAFDNVVKVEANLHDDDEKTSQPPKSLVRFSASDFFALWRPAWTGNRTAGPHLGTLTVGSVIFAPCRVQSGAPLARGSLNSAYASSPPPPPPYRLHYALAEVTGIQVMAGTVTVSFLFTDPGVDDEAISLYECIPCPPACLTRWLQDSNGTGERRSNDAVECVGNTSASPARCSLLERVLCVAPDDGPLPVSDIYSTLTSSTVRNGRRRASRLSTTQQRCASRLRNLWCLSDTDNDDEDGAAPQSHDEGLKGGSTSKRKKALETKGRSLTSEVSAEDTEEAPQQLQQAGTAKATADDGGAASHFVWGSGTEDSSSAHGTTTVLTARYRVPLTLHVFFARVFEKVNTYMETQRHPSSARTPLPHPAPPWRGPSPRDGLSGCPPPVILALFDSYAALRRFHVYMTVRGHVVQLQDGTDNSSSGKESSYAAQTSSSSATTATRTEDVCQGRPPRPPRIPVAFGTVCKVWLCMLRDDTGEEDANANADASSAASVVATQLARLLRAAPPIDGLVTFREYEKGQDDDRVEGSGVTAEQVLLRMLPHLSSARLVCNLHDVPSPSLRSGTTTTATANTQSAATSVVKVSGAIFGDHKLLVPCSPEQLTLLASVLADAPPPLSSSFEMNGTSSTNGKQKRSAQKRPRTTEDSPLQALTPALLERVALGTFTDTAASALFDAFGDASAAVMAAVSSLSTSPSAVRENPTAKPVPQVAESSLFGHGTPPALLGSVEDVYEKWCVDPARFGEAFPVFQAVYALVADVFRSPALFRSENRQQQQGQGVEKLSAQPTFSADLSSLPRVALVLPRGNPTHHPSLSTQQFLHSLRLFFTPWTLHELGPIAMTAAAATTTAAAHPASMSSSPFWANTCVLWHQRGGLLLLFCDEPTTQLGALQDEADVVVACGKAAAAWVAANAAVHHPQNHYGRPFATTSAASSAVYFAVISEVEVVPLAEHGAHLWLPVRLPSPSLADASHDEEGDGVFSEASGRESMASMTAALRWPATAANAEELARGQLELLWERLLCAVDADGCPAPCPSAASPTSTRLPQQPQNLSSARNGSAASHPPSSSSSVPGRRLRHVDVLPKTLRQAVVLWRHLGGTPQEAAPAKKSAAEGGTPWCTLRALVRAIALSSAAATPVRMSDVVLVRRLDSASE